MQNTNKKPLFRKSLEFITGDWDKWKKIPSVIEQIGESLKNDPRERIILIIIGISVFSIVFGGMMVLKNEQWKAQYCEVIVGDNTIHINPLYDGFFLNGTEIRKDMEELALPIPESGHNYKWYLKYYKDGRKQPWVGLNCTWDFKRYMEERW